jgi:hypothetical protein
LLSGRNPAPKEYKEKGVGVIGGPTTSGNMMIVMSAVVAMVAGVLFVGGGVITLYLKD